MSLVAVQNYLQSVLDGLVSPNLPPAQAWVLPPPQVPAGEFPQIFVWGGDLDETRATMPRAGGPAPAPAGQKRVTHTVLIWVLWISDNELQNGMNFPLLLDAIRGVLRSVDLSVPLVDPVTGEESVLTDLGERIQQTYATPKPMDDQRYLANAAQLKAVTHEWIRG